MTDAATMHPPGIVTADDASPVIRDFMRQEADLLYDVSCELTAICFDPCPDMRWVRRAADRCELASERARVMLQLIQADDTRRLLVPEGHAT